MPKSRSQGSFQYSKSIFLQPMRPRKLLASIDQPFWNNHRRFDFVYKLLILLCMENCEFTDNLLWIQKNIICCLLVQTSDFKINRCVNWQLQLYITRLIFLSGIWKPLRLTRTTYFDFYALRYYCFGAPRVSGWGARQRPRAEKIKSKRVKVKISRPREP